MCVCVAVYAAWKDLKGIADIFELQSIVLKQVKGYAGCAG